MNILHHKHDVCHGIRNKLGWSSYISDLIKNIFNVCQNIMGSKLLERFLVYFGGHNFFILRL